MPFPEGFSTESLHECSREHYRGGPDGTFCCQSPGLAPRRAMNILFLMADEFRFDAAGFAGNTTARTPNLDGLARGARVFENAHTPAPVCVPARQCLATGKYPRQIGCEHFGDDIAPGSMTFARWFSEHGYYTVVCGKLHHRGPDQMQGWMHRIGSETAVRWPEKYRDRSQIGRRRWAGAADLKNAGAGISPLGLHDDYSVRGACDFLKMQDMYAVPRDIPLLLMVSLQQPHFPLLTEPELLEYYQERVPVFWNEPAAGHPALDKGRLDETSGVTKADARRATAAYYGMVEQTDRRIGTVLKALEDAGHDLNEWAIVFTSDHGEMLGQHGLWEKRKFYDASVKVPLFVRAPGVAPGRSRQVCNLVDIFPTLAGLAGLPAPDGLAGEDLFASRRDNATFSQYDGDHFLLREGDLKYLRFPGAQEVLFDLATDPGETVNRIADPAYSTAVEALRFRLDDLLAASACESRAAQA
jgi:choline-sulfatase